MAAVGINIMAIRDHDAVVSVNTYQSCGGSLLSDSSG